MSVKANTPGKPCSLMKASPSLYMATGPGVPGTTGTPTFIATSIRSRISPKKTDLQFHIPRFRAFVLSPSPSITSGEGPTKARPACSTFFANPAFSDKKPYLEKDSLAKLLTYRECKPYPGWIISTPCSRAILIISSWAR